MGRASPALLFGLAPRGVCRAPDVATGAVGSYPTVSPLPSAAAIEDLPEVLPPADHRGRLRRRFIFCGTFHGRAVTGPTPWRYQARCPAESGLSSRPSSCDKAPAITRPARHSHYTAVGRGERRGDFRGDGWPADFFPLSGVEVTGSLPSSRASKSSSLKTVTPRDLALSNFEPGSAPTTT